MDQLSELSLEAKQNLLDWFIRTENRPVVDDMSLRLCIGQMIEFIDENREGFWVDWSIIQDNNRGKPSWYIHEQNNSVEPTKRYVNQELCDALWQAVKEILEDESKTTTLAKGSS